MDEITRQLTAFLADRTNYERTRPDRPRFTLDTMRSLLAALGDAGILPAGGGLTARAVQIAGSKGKGTTAAWLAELARSSGLRVGVYASPHVHSLCERVQLDGRDIGPADLEAAVHAVTEVADRIDTPTDPSFFEILTAAAAVAMQRAGVELAIFEAGLGARLDATTAVPVELSIVTGVELEHTAILGDTVAAIAAEKAWAIRRGGRGLTAATGPALDVLREHVARESATLEIYGEHFGCDADPAAGGGLSVRHRERRVELADPGCLDHERPALALAYAAFQTLWPGRALGEPLERPRLPGRCEFRRCEDGELLLLDGAHTVESARVAARELLSRTGGRRATALVALARGKRSEEVLSALRPAVDTVLATRLSDTPSIEPASLVAEATALGMRAEAVADAAAGYARLMAMPGPRCVLGSFYLIGAVQEFVARRSSEP